MARNNNIIGAISGASFLLVLLGLLIFLYAQSFTASAIFPQDAELWNKILTGYLLIFALVMIGAIVLVPEVVRSLATANYWKSFLFKFIPSALVTTLILILIKSLLKGTGSINIFSAISYIPISVLLVHLFVISQIEELMFGGLVYTAIEKKFGTTPAEVISIGLFSIFHYAKTGGSLVVMATYIPLRYVFNYTRNNGYPLLNKIPGIGQKLFGATPRTQQSNAGMHFGWNMFVLGFLKPLQV